jgi:choline dehydrogenase-like flavoprotein
MIRLWMDLGRDDLEHEHHSVAPHDGEVVISVFVTTTLIENIERQLGPIEGKRGAQIVDDKKGSSTVQHNEAAVGSNIAYVEARTIGNYMPDALTFFSACDAVARNETAPGRGLKALPIPKAILPQDYRGRPRCHHCGPCWQGCDSGSKFDSLRVFVQKAQKTGHLTLLTGARVRSLELGDEGQIKSAHYWDVQDRTYREIRARSFVLAAGCIESTQILLNSKIANSSELVGRYFSEHLYGSVDGFLPQLMNRPVVNEDGNGANIFIPDLTRNWRGKKFIRGYQIYPMGGIPETTLVGLNIPGFGAAWKQKIRGYYPASASVLMQGEVLPYRDNRIEVDETLKDDAGIPGVRFYFGLRDNEHAMFEDFLEVATELMTKAGAEMLLENKPKPFQHGASVHYVGTARMGNDPRSSVCDGWNRSHDVANLYLNDAAVFVNAGNQNPTLTILALAMRSSEHMLESMQKGEVSATP